MNPLSENITKGTFGELLVQIRLLQYGVQAAPPLKDSGNDLIGVKGESFRAIQVKTRTGDRIQINDLPHLYHIIALVVLDPYGEGVTVSLDRCRVFLISRDEYERGINDFEEYEISQDRVDELFSLQRPRFEMARAG